MPEFDKITTIEKRRRLSLMQAECRRLNEEIGREERACSHTFGDVVYDPETLKEPTGFKLVAQGSDAWSEPTGYHDVTKPRWKRVCIKCGKVERTYEQKPAAFVPDFGGR